MLVSCGLRASGVELVSAEMATETDAASARALLAVLLPNMSSRAMSKEPNSSESDRDTTQDHQQNNEGHGLDI